MRDFFGSVLGWRHVEHVLGWNRACDPVEQGAELRNLQPESAVGFNNAQDALSKLAPVVFPPQKD
jgi:hypothetical protein